MGIMAELLGLVRGRQEVQADIGTGKAASVTLNPRGDLLMCHALPELAEIVRMRNSYVASLDQAGTAVAPSAALPTTSASGGMSIYNGEQDGGKCYLIEELFGHVVVAAAAATPLGFACMLNVGKFTNATAPVADVTPRGLAGQAYRGSALVDLAYAGTIVDDGWCPVGTSAQAIAGSVGMTWNAVLRGLYVVPPGHMFHFVPLANTAATITVKFGLKWHEVQLPIGG